MESNGTEMYFDADEIVDLLDHFEEADDFDHYEKVLELGRKLHPENQDIKIRMCRSLIHSEEYDKALQMIERIGDTEDLELNLLKMGCFCALDRYDEIWAFINARQAQNSEELEDVFEYLAPVMNELNKLDEVHALIRKGLEFFPDNLVLKEEYCYYLEMQGQPQQALPICNELIDADPYEIDYWYMQGRIYLTLSDYDKAVDAFDFALACDETDVEIKILKAYCLFMNKHYEKAIEVYLDVLEDDCPVDEENIQPYLAECYMKSEHFEQAYAIFKKLIDNENMAKGLALYKNFIHCCLETERENEANELLPTVAACFPEDLLLLVLQAFAHLVKGEQEDVVRITGLILDLVYQVYAQKRSTPEMVKSMDYLGRNLKQIITEIQRLIEPQIKTLYFPVHQAMKHLTNGHMKQFCRKYETCSPEMVSGYLYEMFSVIRGAVTIEAQEETVFLPASEIRLPVAECVASNKLSSRYLENIYHNN
jgi:tetratricopeptide (TPR) repeat protein